MLINFEREEIIGLIDIVGGTMKTLDDSVIDDEERKELEDFWKEILIKLMNNLKTEYQHCK